MVDHGAIEFEASQLQEQARQVAERAAKLRQLAPQEELTAAQLKDAANSIREHIAQRVDG